MDSNLVLCQIVEENNHTTFERFRILLPTLKYDLGPYVPTYIKVDRGWIKVGDMTLKLLYKYL